MGVVIKARAAGFKKGIVYIDTVYYRRQLSNIRVLQLYETIHLYQENK